MIVVRVSPGMSPIVFTRLRILVLSILLGLSQLVWVLLLVRESQRADWALEACEGVAHRALLRAEHSADIAEHVLVTATSASLLAADLMDCQPMGVARPSDAGELYLRSVDVEALIAACGDAGIGGDVEAVELPVEDPSMPTPMTRGPE